MKNLKQPDENEYKEIDGFRDWKVFFDFIKDKYSDVSIAILKKDFEMTKETMRELLDNTYPYQSKFFKVAKKPIDDKYQEGVNDSEYYEFLDYPDYYELLVDEYYKTKDLEAEPYNPHNNEMIAIGKDKFMKETRRLRRMIMTDLSTSAILPQAIKKKVRKVSEEMEGVGL